MSSYQIKLRTQTEKINYKQHIYKQLVKYTQHTRIQAKLATPSHGDNSRKASLSHFINRKNAGMQLRMQPDGGEWAILRAVAKTNSPTTGLLSHMWPRWQYMYMPASYGIAMHALTAAVACEAYRRPQNDWPLNSIRTNVITRLSINHQINSAASSTSQKLVQCTGNYLPKTVTIDWFVRQQKQKI